MATPSKKSAKKVAAKGVKSAKKSGLVFPVGRIGSKLRKGRYSKRVSTAAAVYMAATLEFLTAEMLELAASVVKKANEKKSKSGKTKRITPRSITLGVRHDADMGSLLKDVVLAKGGVLPHVDKALERKKKASKKASTTPRV
jgi:histone H2A